MEQSNNSKEFKPTSWAIDNRTSIYIITLIIALVGILAYNRLQKENFPDIVIPTMIVTTVYPGTSPSDMENLVTRPIEKQIKSLNGVKKVTSTSMQDFAMITVEFNTGVDVEVGKQRVKDAVDKAKTDLPTDLDQAPDVQEISFSEMPIMYVNLSGNFSAEKLKQFAEDLQDRMEALPEITRVDIVGALEQEVQVNLDMYKMQVARVTFMDIERAIATENMTISGGTVRVGDMKRAVRVVGQYTDPTAIGDIVVKSLDGGNIYLRDIAQVTDTFEERESFARLDNDPVITLNVVKRSGENLIEASDKINAIIDQAHGTQLPESLKITVTGDQSTSTRHTLNDLINTIIIGFILVTLILMFFMGTTNALFVGLSVPISMFIAFLIMPMIGFSLNMIVLFSFLLALGIVVDDAIVVIENTHRIYHETNWDIAKSAKMAAGEVFLPVLAGTLTTVAPFLPLAFWPGIVGEFMFYLPITLIITLMASLVVAFIINPVFAVSFMRRESNPAQQRKTFRLSMLIMGGLALLSYLVGWLGIGNLVVVLMAFVALNKFVFTGWINKFQRKVLPAFMSRYERLLRWMLIGRRPYKVLGLVVALLFGSFIITALRAPKVVFFPQGDPNFIYTYISMPVGTDQSVTDSITRVVERRVFQVVGQKNPNVESIISNVAVGAGDPMAGSRQAESNKGRVTVAFVEYQDREPGVSTARYLDDIREAVKGIPGAEITVEQEQNGPPVGKPILVEIAGEDFAGLIQVSKNVQRYLDSAQIAGVEDLRTDLEDKNPEITIEIDRVRANREGVSTAQIGAELRTAIFGKEASKFKKDEDEYPIQIRLAEQYRKNIDQLMGMVLTFRDAAGMVRQVPVSAVATIKYSTTYGGIKRKNLKRVISLSSNVLGGYNPNEVVANIQTALDRFPTPAGYEIRMGGEQEDQKETMDFLSLAGIASMGLIFLVLVTQFNSVSKSLIILSEVIFSVIGVLLGFSVFNMDMSIVMTGIGIIALAGIVVKNGILLVEFTDVLLGEGMELEEAIVMAGKTRLSPVMLTATATILGLIPLAIGLNFNFFTLFTQFDPHFFLGGENVTFWGPLAWTIIFGLSFATFLTLLVVPMMYLINERIKNRVLPERRAKKAVLVS
ncbi:efflux RND transporter permease subunit [Rufibacter glacialis]|uniref:Efflux RND transporter permease subunit n=1 Tax=Rufibacter glacialis TaxID=1259555 RepID=A0A5M8Q5K6_9BACT|nr:efflux RND transporter permease subunit [Rufibacter glacialis]KAA6430196.1 efflux RND transporter permease subunit [Rufibacter glacialis]GGK87203.1 copper transporter [Rufibacter glacialis]